ncbi:SDR family NAD(P)-dependent oxidoreductase [Bacillus tianshenii]|nr:SDR family NAD(P)-dependent oxidoreductase [Bacillus tianshenii]
MRLDGKVAFITGASKGIGKATALVLARYGTTVLLNGRDEEALDRLAAEVNEQTDGVAKIFAYDVTDLNAVKETFRTIQKEYKRLDILVNNAGMLADGLLGMVRPEQLEQTMAVNTNAAVYHMQYAARLMMRNRSGSIINVSSIFGTNGESGQVVYSASKAALIGATKSAAKELASANVRVNAITPGFIETDMTKSIPEDKFQERVNSIKMKRIGQPEEVANTILFLASDLSSYVTGQVIGVDGGMVV